MTQRDDFILNIVAQTADMERKLAEIPGTTAKQARAAAKRWEREHIKGQRAQIREAERAAKKMFQSQDKAAKKAGQAWEGALSTAVGNLGADAAREAASAFFDFAQEVADSRNELGDLSGQTGIAVENLSAIRLAARTSGGELAALKDGLKGFPKRLQDMANGTGEAKIAFESMGMSSEDAKESLKDVNGTFVKSIKHLQGIENEGERAATATRLFGESGVILNQVLGDIPLEEFVQLSQQYGDEAGPAAINAAKKYQATMTIVAVAVEKAKGSVFDFATENDRLNNVILGSIGSLEIFKSLTKDLTSNLIIVGSSLKSLASGDIAGAKRVIALAKDNQEILDRAKTSAIEAGKEFLGYQKRLLGAAEKQDDFNDELVKTNTELKKEEAALKKVRAALKEQRSLYGDIGDVLASIRSDLQSNEDKAEESYRKELARISDLGKRGADEAALTKLRFEAEARLERDLLAVKEESAKKELAILQEIRDKQKDARQARLDAEKESAEKIEELNKESAEKAQELAEENAAAMKEIGLSTFASVAEVSTTLLGMMQDTYTRMIEGLQEVGRSEKDELKDLKSRREEVEESLKEREEERAQAFEENQGDRKALGEELAQIEEEHNKKALSDEKARLDSEIAHQKQKVEEVRRAMKIQAEQLKKLRIYEATINSVAAIVATFGSLGAIGGAIAAVPLATSLAAEIAAIQNEPLPQFHTGKSDGLQARFTRGPDEQMVSMTSPERMLNGAGSRALGDDNIKALNQGGQIGPTTVQMVYRGRAVESVVLDLLKGNNRFSKKINNMRGRPLGMAGVING